MKIMNDMIAGKLDNPPSDQQIEIFFHKKLYAISCDQFTTYLKYFYFDKNDVMNETDKWKEFAKHHLSQQLILNIKRFIKRVEACKAFL